MLRLLALISFSCALGALVPAAAHADRGYSKRFGVVSRGDVTIAANTIMSCPSADSRCAAARAGTGSTIRNSAFTMTHVDVDADPTTFNSSSARLDLPEGATVLFAGLYWGSDTKAGDGGVDAPNAAAKGAVQFATGSTWAYQTVTATQMDTSQSFPTRYQGFANVTEQVRAAGSGNYTVANVQAATGSDNFGGWGLVVAYGDPSQPVRWLGVYDGFHQLVDGRVRYATLDGFRTPADGTVAASFGMMVYEGDLGVTGDYVRIGGREVSDALHPADNYFNSLITAHGEHVHAKDPDYLHQLGHEASIVDIDGYLGNDATTAAVQVGVGTDYLQTGPMTLVADHATWAPAFSEPPSIAGEAREGETLTASPGTWSGSPSFEYQWQRCGATCADVPGATASAYAVGSADVGVRLRVRVTATNADGSAAAVSAPTGPVQARCDCPPPPPAPEQQAPAGEAAPEPLPRAGEAAPAACGALTATYTRGRAGTLRLRLTLSGPVTAVDFGVPAAMRPKRLALGRSVGRLRVSAARGAVRGAVREQTLRFNRQSRGGLTVGNRSPRVRLTRAGVRVERIGPRVRRIELTLVTARPAPRSAGVTVAALSRTAAGTLRQDACALITRG